MVCVPNDCELKKAILDEAHNGSFAIHLGSTKMYQDLKMSFWWSEMKRDVCSLDQDDMYTNLKRYHQRIII